MKIKAAPQLVIKSEHDLNLVHAYANCKINQFFFLRIIYIYIYIYISML